MKLFNKDYVHFMWEDELEGKEGFFSDEIGELIYAVENGKGIYGKVKETKEVEVCPFTLTKGEVYRFFYYDPNYDIKRAFTKGEQVMYILTGQTVWNCVESEKDFVKLMSESASKIKFSLKTSESKRMTYRMLGEWLAKKNGQYRSCETGSYADSLIYLRELDNEVLSEGYKVRRWGSDEWLEPTVEVYEKDCKTQQTKEK